MKRVGVRLVLILLTLSLVAVWRPGVARAINVSVDQGLSSDVVEIGEPVTLTLAVSLDDDIEPQQPKLTVPAGIKASRVNTSTMKLVINRSVRRDFTARWVLVPEKLGKFEIEPPSVMVDGTKVSVDKKLSLEVVEKGKGQRGRQSGLTGGGLSSFFAPSAPFDLDDPFFEYDKPRKTFSTSRDLALPRELDDSVFLYLHADKDKAVVGEQIMLSTWLYFRMRFESLEDRKDPPLSAFTRHVLGVPDSLRRRPVETRVGGRGYGALQLGEVAIFPVRTGDLSTGKFSAKAEVIRGGRRTLLPRESNEVIIHVTEPPSQGRPLGYSPGTVGRFKMTADVAPRQTNAGDTVSVSVQVTGVGSLPSQLRLPARMGIEWLKPERKDGVSMVHHNIGGWRTFDYAVRFTQPGVIELGNLELPYWDPDKEKYDVATVELGKVTVKPGAADAAPVTPLTGDDDEKDPFAGIGDPRPALAAFEAPDDQGLLPRTLWTWVLFPPIGVAFASAAVAGARRLRRRRSAMKSDPEVLAREALNAMRRADDAKDAAAAAEKALHLAIGAATGLKSRGMLRAELGDKLKEAVGDSLSGDALALLELCSTVRFEPEASDGAADRVCTRADAIVKALLAA